MIKNIENSSSTDHAEVDENKREEAHNVCNVNCRRESITLNTASSQITQLNTVQEQSKELCTIIDSAALSSGVIPLFNNSLSYKQSAVVSIVGDLTVFTTELERNNEITVKNCSDNRIIASPINSFTQQIIDNGEAFRDIARGGKSTNKVLSSGDNNNSPQCNSSATSSAKAKLPKTPSFSNNLQNSLAAINIGCTDEDSISKSSDTSAELLRASLSQEPNFVDKTKSSSRLSERAKKKSWYNVLYPNYKSRAEDFKKLFKEVPNDERLIVDYSCALQRDILVQGRLYVSQNYVCFHANIFRWETYLTIKWKDVTAITKERTALVIPNAISICTAKEKYFFATFTTRDKAFLMLFRVWQNTLMKKQMPQQEIWQWVHNCYGDELGLTTDDEDYIDPTSILTENEGELDFSSALADTNSLSAIATSDCSIVNLVEIANIKRNLGSGTSTSSTGGSVSAKTSKPKAKSYFFSSNKSSVNSFTTASASSSDNKASDNCMECNSKSQMKGHVNELALTSVKSEENSGSNGVGKTSNVHSNDSNKQQKNLISKSYLQDSKRKVSKNNRMRDEVTSSNMAQLPTDISDSSDSDQNKVPFVPTVECTSAHEGRQLMHTILPINIDTLFNLLFSKSKFLVDFHQMRKTTDTSFGEWIRNEEGKQVRTVNVTVQLAASVGPKTSKVTEFQVMRDCSKVGELYSIDINSVNAGIPYAESFSVLMHYCLVRTIDDHTMLSVHAQIKYKKSIWGVVKGFIEKNTWAGLEDFFTSLLHALQSETCIPPAKGKGRRPRRGNVTLVRPLEDAPETHTKPESMETSLNTHAHIVHTTVACSQALTASPKKTYKWLSVFVILLLSFLIGLNVILLFKLWTLERRIEDGMSSRLFMPNISTFKKLPSTHEEWLGLLRHQEILHETELKKWHKVLETAIELLKKVSIVCDLIYKNGKLSQQFQQIQDEL